jgi:hypothetical protein
MSLRQAIDAFVDYGGEAPRAEVDRCEPEVGSAVARALAEIA